jgi:hypothetical protein
MTKHDEIAEKLAKKFNTEYKANKGIDIVTTNRVIEIETKKEGLLQGIKQIEKSSKARYLAVNQMNIKNAIEATKNSGIGIMDDKGKIIKKASR